MAWCLWNKFITKLFIPLTFIKPQHANFILSLPEIPVWKYLFPGLKHQWINQPTITIRKTTVHSDKPILKGFCLRVLSNLKTKTKLSFEFPFTCLLKFSIMDNGYTTLPPSLISVPNIQYLHGKEDAKNIISKIFFITQSTIKLPLHNVFKPET